MPPAHKKIPKFDALKHILAGIDGLPSRLNDHFSRLVTLRRERSILDIQRL
jgi:hypothetical protein